MSDGGAWRLVITSPAEKQLQSLSAPDQVRVRAALDRYRASPRGDVAKLRGHENEWRPRVPGLTARSGGMRMTCPYL